MSDKLQLAVRLGFYDVGLSTLPSSLHPASGVQTDYCFHR